MPLKLPPASVCTLPTFTLLKCVLCVSILEKENYFPSYERSEKDENLIFTHQIPLKSNANFSAV